MPQRTTLRYKCVGCGGAASQPLNAKEKRFCDSCWKSRVDQVLVEADKFYLWRIVRTPDAEKWGLGFRQTEAWEGGRVGEVCVMKDECLNMLSIDAYLEPQFHWRKKLVVIYPSGVSIEEDYVALAADQLIRFFEVGFDCEHILLELNFLTGECRTYEAK